MHKPFTMGEVRDLTGDITTLNWIVPGIEGATEDRLGYHVGRLAQGYWIGFLQRKPELDEFEFGGTTLRSGGRLGLPADNIPEDQARPRVHDRILTRDGRDATESPEGRARYLELQKAALRSVFLTGASRLAKVLPDIPHDPNMPPAKQYPMGGGGLQWKLVKGCPFHMAVRVDQDGTAKTPEFQVNLIREGYDARARLRRYMEIAKP